MEIVLTIELDAAVRLAEGIFRYAFIAAIIGHRDRADHKFHVHLVRVVRKGRLVLVTCNWKDPSVVMRTFTLSLFPPLVFSYKINTCIFPARARARMFATGECK